MHFDQNVFFSVRRIKWFMMLRSLITTGGVHLDLVKVMSVRFFLWKVPVFPTVVNTYFQVM